jgi:predicted methyltransferase
MKLVRPSFSGIAGLFVLMVFAAAVVACGGGTEPAAEGDAAPAEPAVTEPSGSAAVLEAAGRTDDDRFRDGGFKPLEVYSFFGIEPGMTVVDLASSGMYNAHILAQIVGPEGRVIATSTYGTEPRRIEQLQETLASRNVDGVLDNVEIVGTLEDIEAGTVDVIVTVRNYHDIGEHDARVAAMERFLRVLEPGGILGAVDAHTDQPDERDESVHRINEELARQEIVAGGFEFVDATDILYNPEDTFDFDGRLEGDPIHRYFIQRWVMKFQKPMD